jgi:two-component system cell cycle sensor histidine kinase/response regulator CckA
MIKPARNFPMLEPNHRILIVDDNPAIHEDFRKILCPAGPDRTEVQNLKAALFNQPPRAALKGDFELVSAFQGQEAVTRVSEFAAENRPFAMAFVDVRMPPGWDGIETAARLWKVSPQLQIVICTAYSDYSWDEMRARLDQPDSLVILKKPFDNVEVQQLAHALTNKWLLGRQARLRLSELECMVQERTQAWQKANESLAISEERFSRAFHESPLPSGIQNLANQRFIDVNRSLAHIAGRTREEMMGHTPAEMFLWEKPGLADQWLERLSGGETVRDQEANIQTPSGGLHEVLVSCSRLAFSEEPHVLVLVQDMAERALLERQLRHAQKMEAIGQLAAGVAHDFNNILTVIQGHVGLMECSLPATTPGVKSLDQISKAAERAATLIRQLLMFSRKQVMNFRHLDLNDVLANSITMLERLVGEHVQVNFDPCSSIPAIYADTSMIDQVVMNLAVNARDAMPGGGRICISTVVESIHRPPTPMDPEERAGNFVCCTFTDTGTGMDPQILNRIFEPFFTTKPVGKGTGLGLSTVFGIVREHRGWLTVESQPEQGTTFRLFFPACKQVAEATELVADDCLCTGCETILVAEDEPMLREIVVMVLRIQGYTVLEAASGPEALEVWKRAEHPVHLLLTDMVMPGGMMGSELAERLLRLSPPLKVIYTSGYSPGMEGSDISLSKGRNFLPKPYSLSKLTQFVRACLDDQPVPNDPSNLVQDVSRLKACDK